LLWEQLRAWWAGRRCACGQACCGAGDHFWATHFAGPNVHGFVVSGGGGGVRGGRLLEVQSRVVKEGLAVAVSRKAQVLRM